MNTNNNWKRLSAAVLAVGAVVGLRPAPPAPIHRRRPARRDSYKAWKSMDERVKELIKGYLRDENDWTALIELKGGDAKTALQVIQSLLDDDGLWPEWLQLTHELQHRRKLIHLEVKLAQQSGERPKCLTIRIDPPSLHPERGGGQADVFKSKYKGCDVAMKRLRFFRDLSGDTRRMNAKHFAREALMWMNLRHPNVIELWGVSDDPNTPCMILPWYQNGSLKDHMHCKENGKGSRLLVAQELDQWIQHIANGLEYLHKVGVVHGDLRRANVLMDGEVAKLADFGLSVFAQEVSGTYDSFRGGVERWMAPELLRPSGPNQHYSRQDERSDVYSFSMVCCEIYTRRPPYQETPDLQIGGHINTGLRPPRPEHPTLMAENRFTLTERCWSHNPADRPTMTEVVAVLASLT